MSAVISKGLAHVATARVRALLEAVRGGRVKAPVSVLALKLSGFSDLVPVADVLQHAGNGVAILLEAVLVDREVRRGPALDLVWSGPAIKGDALDTRAVVQRLFANAEDHVMICGFAFYQAREIFAGLHQRAQQRDLRIEFFVHFAATGMKSAAAFFTHTWPWRDVVPDVYYDPRALAGAAAMHAKSVVVDGRYALVTSANFTAAAHSSNVEVGALIDDTHFAAELMRQWARLKAMEVFVPFKSEP